MAESAAKGGIYVNGFPGRSMLNRHNNLFVPQSERLKVGDAVVDIPRREVVLPDGSTNRLTHKAQQVLLMLVNHQGHVVSREAILEWVWPTTLPTNDVVTQAITQLRRALADDAAAPRFVETIAKTGYRLIAPLEWQPDSDKETEPPGDPAPGRRKNLSSRTRVYAITAGAAAVAVVALGMFVSADFRGDSAGAEGGVTVEAAQQGPPDITVRNLTSGPVQESAPRLSPDGSMVAYVVNDPEIDDGHARIMIQASMLTAARQLTTPKPNESDVGPAWSPDGRQIAFKRWSSDETCTMMIVSASGGIERPIAGCGNSGFFDWTADGTGLIANADVLASDGGASALTILDISSGRWRDLVYDRAPDDVDLEPRYSPDGEWIGFRRNFSLTDIWKVPASGGKPIRLTWIEGDIRGWDWTPDSKAIVFSINEVRRLGLHRLDLASGRVEWLGIEGAMMPDIAAHVASVVFTLAKSSTTIYRYRFSSSGSNSAIKREPLFPVSGSNVLTAISPDGRTLAYLSDRSGELQLWLGEVGRPKTLHPVEHLLPIPSHAPVWSPNGSQLLVVGHAEGKPWLYEVDIASARATRIELGKAVPVYAAYLPGGNRLVGVHQGGGELELLRYRVVNGRWKSENGLPGVSAVRLDEKNGHVYFTRAGKAGLWRTDVSLSGTQQVSAGHPSVFNYRGWQVFDGAVWFLDMRKGCSLWWRPLADDDASAGMCLEEKASSTIMPSVSPDGAWLYSWTQDDANMDIGWAELPPMPGSAVPATKVNPGK